MELGSEEDSEYDLGQRLGHRARRHSQRGGLVLETLQRTTLVGTNEEYAAHHDEGYFVAMA